MLSLTEPARITLSVREKFQTKGCGRHAIQVSGKHDVAIAKRRRCDHRIILLVIGPARGVAMIICRWRVHSAATCGESNAEPCIVVNGVTENGPPGVIASEAGNADAVEGIECDDVPFPCIHTTDYPDGCIASGDAAVSVAQRRAVNVGANLVSLDHYACGTTADDDSVCTRVDYIACAWHAATDHRVN
jgi:hypothetical protein